MPSSFRPCLKGNLLLKEKNGFSGRKLYPILEVFSALEQALGEFIG